MNRTACPTWILCQQYKAANVGNFQPHKGRMVCDRLPPCDRSLRDEILIWGNLGPKVPFVRASQRGFDCNLPLTSCQEKLDCPAGSNMGGYGSVASFSGFCFLLEAEKALYEQKAKVAKA